MVFHVSKLKKKIGQGTHTKQILPPVAADRSIHPYPKVILARCLFKCGNKADAEVLIKWQGVPDAYATWECYKVIEE